MNIAPFNAKMQHCCKLTLTFNDTLKIIISKYHRFNLNINIDQKSRTKAYYIEDNVIYSIISLSAIIYYNIHNKSITPTIYFWGTNLSQGFLIDLYNKIFF